MVEVTGSSLIDVRMASTSVESDEKEGEYAEPGDLLSLLRRRRRFLEDERGGGGKFKGQPAWQLEKREGLGSEH